LRMGLILLTAHLKNLVNFGSLVRDIEYFLRNE